MGLPGERRKFARESVRLRRRLEFLDKGERFGDLALLADAAHRPPPTAMA
jgi:hypothetical protein